MPEAQKGVRPNDCFVTDNVVTSARNLVKGFPLTPINFTDLCQLIEMVVLHERIVVTLPPPEDSPLYPLIKSRLVTSTLYTEVTPDAPAEAAPVKRVYETCIRCIKEGGVWGRSVMNLAKSPEEQHENDLTQMRGAQMLLDLETGRRQATAVAQKTVEKLRSIYAVYEDYADAVFGAARAHHVNAYAGATEIIFAVRNTVQSAPLNLYEHLKTLHVEQVDRFLAERGFRTYAIPPFASIVLSRCKRREDIVPELLRARDEFSAFRETCTHHARRVRDACLGGTHEDVIRMSNDLDRAMEVLSRKVKQSEKDRRWVYRVWDVVKELEPLGMAKSLIDKLIANDIEREHLRSLNGLMDVWKKLSKASSYERVLRSGLFPNEYMPEEFAAFSEWAESVPQVVGLRRSSDPPSPSAGTESTAKTTAKRRRTPNSSVSGRAAPRRRRKK